MTYQIQAEDVSTIEELCRRGRGGDTGHFRFKARVVRHYEGLSDGERVVFEDDGGYRVNAATAATLSEDYVSEIKRMIDASPADTIYDVDVYLGAFTDPSGRGILYYRILNLSPVNAQANFPSGHTCEFIDPTFGPDLWCRHEGCSAKRPRTGG